MRLTLNEAPPRLSMALLLAAPLVYALFLTASWLIKVEEVVLAERETRPLTRITPTSPEVVIRPEDNLKPQILAEKPPPPPRPVVTTTGTTPGFIFAPPSEDLAPSTFRPLPVSVSPVAGRNIQVVRAPAPSMPAIAVTRGISGSCDVLFDVDRRGRPFNLTAQCTDEIFRAEAIRAVSKAEFLPKVSQNGIAVEQYGAIYPIAFEVR